ncbi:nucleoside-diphosphate-sugar epimerase [Longilinea arvoryzae]|uniref:Nucleoside-diphosphate-sugar epimerase n=1 Tax=Longilinea arvoryzae TaxID=360412 RepID=A0A0S7BEG4_9CHLR|nr:NAD-dependent epimerase/dehydratase family protein [Longilinea arvoryzae]GAP13933.1 nucleoside-diphosphate-sugar epimerase [Longilinea arvoryzae]
MATYLVTGAAGFIGARVSEMLLAGGHSVVAIDNLNDAYDVRLKTWRLNRLKPIQGFHFYENDLGDRAALDRLAAENPGIAGIINLAARAGVRASLENPWVFLESNTTGTLNLLELARRNGIAKFILASTSSIYGANPPYPTPEDADSSQPLQAYAATKKGAEVMCHAYHHLYGIDVTIFRYFTVYGPAGRPDLAMFRFVQRVAEGRTLHVNGDGTQSRGFTYIDDIARGTILGLKPLGYEVMNLGGHESISINDLISMIEEMLGRKAQIEHHPFHPADMMNNLADVRKAQKMLGWQPQVGLREGVRHLIDWYMAERNWASQVITE